METRPNRKMLYGVLHDEDGTPKRQQVVVLKAGIGVPAGPDVHVWIDAQHKWAIETGAFKDGKRVAVVERFDTKEQAMRRYQEARRTAAERKYPRKNPYFTFLKVSMDGNFVHDFDAIEQHGALPTEIDVMFFSNDPFDYKFAWWTAKELQCSGDGRNAERRNALAKTPEEKKLAAEAAAAGRGVFPIVNGCFASNCQYARGDKPVCKPSGILSYQLMKSPRIGGTCTYYTTGFRSIKQIASCLREIKTVSGHGDPELGSLCGIPLKMVLRPYRVTHGGKSSVQYAVSLEFRGSGNAAELSRLLVQHAQDFRQTQLSAAIRQPVPHVPQLEAPQITEPIPEVTFADGEELDMAEGGIMEAEFYGNFEEVEEDEDGPQEPPMPRRISEPPQMPGPALVAKTEPVGVATIGGTKFIVSELKRAKEVIGEDRLLQILVAHGLEKTDLEDLTMERWTALQPDIELAERARAETAKGSTAPPKEAPLRPVFGSPPPRPPRK